MLNQYKVDMKDSSVFSGMDISGFLRLLCELRSGKAITLSDGTVVLNDRCRVVQITPRAVFTSSLPVGLPTNSQSNDGDDGVTEEVTPRRRRYRKLRRGKYSSRYVQPWHYKNREKLGILSRQDIKGFKLDKLVAFSRSDLKDLDALGITTLDGLTATSIAGLRHKIQKAHGVVSPSLFSRLLGSIKRAFDPIGLKFPNVHPHNENKDGSPKKPVVIGK